MRKKQATWQQVTDPSTAQVYLNGVPVEAPIVTADADQGYVVIENTKEKLLETVKGEIKIMFNGKPCTRVEFRRRAA